MATVKEITKPINREFEIKLIEAELNFIISILGRIVDNRVYTHDMYRGISITNLLSELSEKL